MGRLSARDKRIDKVLKRPAWKIGEREYRIAWCERIEGKDTLGYCDDEAGVIYLKTGQTFEESFKTLIHELIHAFEKQYRIPLSHRSVYKLELAIFELLNQNEMI